jgi:hypothetical protein
MLFGYKLEYVIILMNSKFIKIEIDYFLIFNLLIK